MMPREKAEAFIILWFISVGLLIGVVVVLANMRRIPVLLWRVASAAVAIAMLALVLNAILDLIIVASV